MWTCFAYSVVPSTCLWILDALLSLGLPESLTEGYVGSIPHGIHPTKCLFLMKVLTLNSSVALWLCWDHQLLPLGVKQQTGKASFTSCQLLYCYCRTQVTTWRDFFPCSKGFLLLTLHCLWHALTELETCSGKDAFLTLHFIVSLSQQLAPLWILPECPGLRHNWLLVLQNSNKICRK